MDKLIDHYRKTHATRVYGTSSVKYLRFLRPEIRLRAPKSILDYGCGQSLFIDLLGLRHPVALHRYDPAIPEFRSLPAKPVDLLVSIDVLEHIEEHDLDRVLAEMRSLCHDAIIIVDTVPAKHTLADGRNAHRTVRPHAWWAERIGRHFGTLQRVATPRWTRAGFKTWGRSGKQRLRYAQLRFAEDLSHGMRRLLNRHNSHWKVSKIAKGPNRH
jgi:hypothetical protein